MIYVHPIIWLTYEPVVVLQFTNFKWLKLFEQLKKDLLFFFQLNMNSNVVYSGYILHSKQLIGSRI